MPKPPSIIILTTHLNTLLKHPSLMSTYPRNPKNTPSQIIRSPHPPLILSSSTHLPTQIHCHLPPHQLSRRYRGFPTSFYPKKCENVASDCLFVGIHSRGVFMLEWSIGDRGDCVLCHVGKRSTFLGNLWDQVWRALSGYQYYQYLLP